MENAPRFIHNRGAEDLLEIPITTLQVSNRNIPCGGGGWFRLYPYMLSKWALNQVNNVDQEPCIFYFHPWEIDPDQPRQINADAKTKFRHYVNIPKTEQKIENLLNDFRWGTMEDVFMPSKVKSHIKLD